MSFFDGYIAALEDISKLINHKSDQAERYAHKDAKDGDYDAAVKQMAECNSLDRLYNVLADISGALEPLDTHKQIKKKVKEFYD